MFARRAFSTFLMHLYNGELIHLFVLTKNVIVLHATSNQVHTLLVAILIFKYDFWYIPILQPVIKSILIKTYFKCICQRMIKYAAINQFVNATE